MIKCIQVHVLLYYANIVLSDVILLNELLFNIN